MKNILEILKEHHIGKVYDLYVYTNPNGTISESLRFTNEVGRAQASCELIQITVKDVHTDDDIFWLTFNETDKIFSLSADRNYF